MCRSEEGKAAVYLWYDFVRPTGDHRLTSASPEVEDSIANANGENVSGSGPNNEHNVSRENSLEATQKVARAILVRDV